MKKLVLLSLLSAAGVAIAPAPAIAQVVQGGRHRPPVVRPHRPPVHIPHRPGIRRHFGGGNFGFGGGFIGGFFFQPQFQVHNFQLYHLPIPGRQRRWVRYHDDAVLIGHDGRVFDRRGGIQWDRGGERWERDDQGIPYYVGRGDFRPDERDYDEVAEERHGGRGGWDYSEYRHEGGGEYRDDRHHDDERRRYPDDDRYERDHDDRDRDRHHDDDRDRHHDDRDRDHDDRRGYDSRDHDSGYAHRSGGHGYAPVQSCAPQGCNLGHPGYAPAPAYNSGGYGQSYGSGAYGYGAGGYGYSSGGTTIITETTVTPIVTQTITEEVIEEVVEERHVRRRAAPRRPVRRIHRPPPPVRQPAGERG